MSFSNVLCYCETILRTTQQYYLISLTLWLQQAGDVELPLSQVERLFQVLLVASGLDQ